MLPRLTAGIEGYYAALLRRETIQRVLTFHVCCRHRRCCATIHHRTIHHRAKTRRHRVMIRLRLHHRRRAALRHSEPSVRRLQNSEPAGRRRCIRHDCHRTTRHRKDLKDLRRKSAASQSAVAYSAAAGSLRCSRGPLNYSSGLLDRNCGAIRRNRGLPCRLCRDARPTHLDVLFQDVLLQKDALIQATGAEASAKISASRHRCGRWSCEPASSQPNCRAWVPIPNSSCLAFQAEPEDCLPDRCLPDHCLPDHCSPDH